MSPWAKDIVSCFSFDEMMAFLSFIIYDGIQETVGAHLLMEIWLVELVLMRHTVCQKQLQDTSDNKRLCLVVLILCLPWHAHVGFHLMVRGHSLIVIHRLFFANFLQGRLPLYTHCECNAWLAMSCPIFHTDKIQFLCNVIIVLAYVVYILQLEKLLQ